MDKEDKVGSQSPELESGVAHPIDTGIPNAEGKMDLDVGHQLQRGLKSRHIQFLALGGA
jgi:yeast amino acid transporter